MSSEQRDSLPDPDPTVKEIVNDPDVKRYMARLYERLLRYARRAAAVGKGKAGSIEQLGMMGKFWWRQREIRHMSRNDVADGLAEKPEEIGVMKDNVIFFEIGLAEPSTYRGDFPRRYADVLGDAELYKQYCERFYIPYIAPQEFTESPKPK